ncbi:uncharacterized protein RAG0_01200 [Rhynchosporium agropyri]|uniref:Uncharacterized protein n=1 Tax=Rhynchosporium agropyri TaxID=914238 RepID=A0A1E1JVZ0_9HELO|nr:uncharacterized protein RAG0_01200 [Rhynchosporium agropyri]
MKFITITNFLLRRQTVVFPPAIVVAPPTGNFSRFWVYNLGPLDDSGVDVHMGVMPPGGWFGVAPIPPPRIPLRDRLAWPAVLFGSLTLLGVVIVLVVKRNSLRV